MLTGDLAPHGYPQDQAPIDSATTLGDMCAAKFDITKRAVRDLVQYFPNTRWAYAIGNNDHFPKDVYWQAYVTKLADMMFEEGLYTSEQHAQV